MKFVKYALLSIALISFGSMAASTPMNTSSQTNVGQKQVKNKQISHTSKVKAKKASHIKSGAKKAPSKVMTKAN
ncbi:hypothetical protein QE197_14240 [Arsenophonus nasoniae]|nr:hypothetical protein [Arsenophonus nasoniae]QBY44660.1 hypothetical protein ArsFIN_32460 [Arsenophonus nasoniae]WGM00857.1 hypothetical protein QE210_13505 [Arsenophonus nasoniae]WGM04899.1 hypothetical protein QE258_15080 [Arsenophonus nasoniae]WGM09997.1 hypothetical protein QE197_14240 [Arsenophonus nasoniae]WGM14715.1 hypothetical protein QE193_14155 [Arsenophonus nasoniae]